MLARTVLAVLASLPTAAQGASALDHYDRGRVHAERGETSAALKEFRRAHALDPGPHRGQRIGMHFEDYDPEFQMARLYLKLGRWQEAGRLLERCAAHGYTERSGDATEFRSLLLLVRTLQRSCWSCSAVPGP